MPTNRDVILTVDYHLEHLEVRWLNCASGQEQRRNIPTDRRSIEGLVTEALAEAGVGGGQPRRAGSSRVAFQSVRGL